MVVFLVSGLWHGASWNFIIWGALNGIYQVAGAITAPFRKKLADRVNGGEVTFSSKLLKLMITFALICFSWIFFRANTMSDALLLIKNLFVYNPWFLTDGTLFTFGLDQKDMLVLFLSLLVLFVVSLAKYRKVEIREWVLKQGIWFRYALYLVAIFAVLIFGVYGSNYDSATFIYFQF